MHGIIEQHDGGVFTYSEPGQGTTFRIYLPLAESGEEDEASETDEDRVLTGDELVHLVEDDDAVRELAENILIRAGYAVIADEHPAQALESHASLDTQPVLLLTDVVMPEMNGPELYERLREQNPDLAVLFMSGFTGNRRDGRRTLPEHAPLIHKPFRARDLLHRIRQQLDQR